jgi:hypothetical protein
MQQGPILTSKDVIDEQRTKETGIKTDPAAVFIYVVMSIFVFAAYAAILKKWVLLYM